MQKYIAVVNPKMDEDEITRLIRKGIAGAVFSISHQNYHAAARLVDLVKKLAQKYNRHISIIQDVSEMHDSLDLQFGQKLGSHWIATDKHEHVKMARGLNKLAGVIFKGRNLPKGEKVDAVMASGFVDPDAEILGKDKVGIKHFSFEHPKQATWDSLMHLADHANTSAIAVSDLGLAKAMSMRRPNRKIIFAAKDPHTAAKASIFWGVHPIIIQKELVPELLRNGLVKKSQKIFNAIDDKHITIHSVA